MFTFNSIKAPFITSLESATGILVFCTSMPQKPACTEYMSYVNGHILYVSMHALYTHSQRERKSMSLIYLAAHHCANSYKVPRKTHKNLSSTQEPQTIVLRFIIIHWGGSDSWIEPYFSFLFCMRNTLGLRAWGQHERQHRKSNTEAVKASKFTSTGL